MLQNTIVHVILDKCIAKLFDSKVSLVHYQLAFQFAVELSYSTLVVTCAEIFLIKSGERFTNFPINILPSLICVVLAPHLWRNRTLFALPFMCISVPRMLRRSVAPNAGSESFLLGCAGDSADFPVTRRFISFHSSDAFAALQTRWLQMSLRQNGPLTCFS